MLDDEPAPWLSHSLVFSGSPGFTTPIVRLKIRGLVDILAFISTICLAM